MEDLVLQEQEHGALLHQYWVSQMCSQMCCEYGPKECSKGEYQGNSYRESNEGRNWPRAEPVVPNKLLGFLMGFGVTSPPKWWGDLEDVRCKHFPWSLLKRVLFVCLLLWIMGNAQKMKHMACASEADSWSCRLLSTTRSDPNPNYTVRLWKAALGRLKWPNHHWETGGGSGGRHFAGTLGRSPVSHVAFTNKS